MAGFVDNFAAFGRGLAGQPEPVTEEQQLAFLRAQMEQADLFQQGVRQRENKAKTAAGVRQVINAFGGGLDLGAGAGGLANNLRQQIDGGETVGSAVASVMPMTPQYQQAQRQATEQQAAADEMARQEKVLDIRKKQSDAEKAEQAALKARLENELFDIDNALIERERIRAENRRALAELEAAENGLALPGPGQAAITSPITGQPQIAYLPGSPEYDEARTRVQGALGTLQLTARIMADIDQAGTSGTDFLGTRATRVDANRSQLFSTIFQMRGLGAPQGPDIELVEKGLPDSTGFWANVRGGLTGGAGGQKASILQGYQTVQEEAQQALTNELLANPFLIDYLTDYDVGLLHPDSDLAKLIRKLRGQ